MQRIGGLVLIVVLVLVSGVSMSHSNDDLQYIYLLEAADCVSLPEARSQTGFRLQGVQGIVTALHGVVGCSHITARRPETGEVHNLLVVALVDVERDVAVLAGPTLPIAGGLQPHPTGIPDQSEVIVLGHPAAIPTTWKMPLQVESFALRPLYDVLPPNLFQAVQQRKSPEVGVLVLRLNGNLQPGHSGAPIIDQTGKVLGIGSGGLGDGTLGIGWAIPLSGINWKPRHERERDLYDVAAFEPTLVFAHKDPEEPLIEPVIRSRGSGCIAQGSFFDLDRGDSRAPSETGDLFLDARTSVERYLVSWSSASLAVIGNRDFERVTLAALKRADFGQGSVNASRDGRNALPAGTVLAVQTNEGRFGMLRVNESRGDYVDFEWITFALPSEGPSPVPPSVESCGVEQQLLCGSGRLEGDDVASFGIVSMGDSELVINVHHRFNPAHGQVWLGARLLDKDGASLSPGFYPTAASPGGLTQVRVPRGTGHSRYLFIWMYDSYKSEAFTCRRFDYRL